MWNMLTRMVGWVYPLSTPPQAPNQAVLQTPTQTITNTIDPTNPINQKNADDDLLKNWEWLLSTAEEIAVKQDQQRSSDIRKELDVIKKVTNSVKYRKCILVEVTKYLDTLSPDIITSLKNSRLDASKRDRIFRDIIRKVSEDWLLNILMDIFVARDFNSSYEGTLSDNNNFDISAFIASNPEAFSSRWNEQPYKKNICGEIASMAFYASHPTQDKGLTAILIADILWSMHVCLSREIISDLNRTLYPQEYDNLTQKVLSILPDLVSLWHATTLKTGNVADRAGRLPEKWTADKQKEDKRLASLKESGVSARYNDGPNDALWKSHLDAVTEKTTMKQSQVLDSKDVFVNRKKQLENSLFFAPKMQPKSAPRKHSA